MLEFLNLILCPIMIQAQRDRSSQPATNISVNPMDSSPSFEASVAPRRSGRNR